MDGFKVEFDPGDYSKMAAATVSFTDEWAMAEFLDNLKPIWVIRRRLLIDALTIRVEFGCNRTISEIFVAAFEAAQTAKKVCRWPRQPQSFAAAAD